VSSNRHTETTVAIDLAYDAIARMDADTLVALCDPEVRFESRITAIENAIYDGHDGVRRYIANLRDAFEYIDVTQSELVERGDRVVVTNRFRARGRGSGLEVEQHFFLAATARRGKLLWWGFFDSRSEALRAVGLAEES
jgi:ketosteroid isomerase-like protein